MICMSSEKRLKHILMLGVSNMYRPSRVAMAVRTALSNPNSYFWRSKDDSLD